MQVDLLEGLLAGGDRVPGVHQLDRLVVDTHLELVKLAIFADDDAAAFGVGGDSAVVAFDGVGKERVGERWEGPELGAGLLEELLELHRCPFECHIGLGFPQESLACHV